MRSEVTSRNSATQAPLGRCLSAAKHHTSPAVPWPLDSGSTRAAWRSNCASHCSPGWYSSTASAWPTFATACGVAPCSLPAASPSSASIQRGSGRSSRLASDQSTSDRSSALQLPSLPSRLAIMVRSSGLEGGCCSLASAHSTELSSRAPKLCSWSCIA
jgi:hypothetical protein